MSSVAETPPSAALPHPALLALTIGAIGVVFGDIGTSPLYAFREALGQTKAGGIDASEILGVLSLALWSLIIAQAWHMVGFPTLVVLAGMQRIPSEMLDAVRMETESEWVRITQIVWPLVAPSATIVFTLLFVGAFNWFELPYIMAGLDGSPYGSTDVLGLYFYRTAFGNVSAGQQNFGLGSALAVLMFVFIAIVATVITVRLRSREIEL